MLRRVASAFVMILGTVVVAGCGQAVSLSAPPPPDPLVVYDTPVIRRVTDHEEFPGRTEAIHTVVVRSRVSGYLEAFLFKDGAMVKEGQELFKIDDRPFRRTLERSKGALAQAEAHAKRLNNEFRRAQVLYERGLSISREEFDRYSFDLAEANAALETSQANLKLAELDVEFTTVKVPKFDPTDPTVHEGRMGRRLVDPGNLIKADDTMMATIVTQDPIHVYFDVHEQAMLRIARLVEQGKIDPKKIPVEIALSDEQDFPHKGEVNFTDNQVDSSTGTLRFRADVRNASHMITPGLFVRVRLPIGDAHSAIMVREQAIQSDQGQKKVFVLRASNKESKPYFMPRPDKEGNPIPAYKPVAVDIGAPGVLQNGFREVERGIKPGDLVVVVGMQKVRVTKEPKDPSEPEDLSNLVKARPFDPERDAVKSLTTPAPTTTKALLSDSAAAKPEDATRGPGAGQASRQAGQPHSDGVSPRSGAVTPAPPSGSRSVPTKS